MPGHDACALAEEIVGGILEVCRQIPENRKLGFEDDWPRSRAFFIDFTYEVSKKMPMG